jgi:hypothetical protein
MSGWHRDHPELAGTDSDPWMMHAGYRQAVAQGSVTDSMIFAAEEARDSQVCECGHRRDAHDPEPGCRAACEQAGCLCEGFEP